MDDNARDNPDARLSHPESEVRRSRRWLLGLGVLLAVFLPWALLAGQVTNLVEFFPATTASASDVNNNFNQVKAAVDDNDTRIGNVESAVGLPGPVGPGSDLESRLAVLEGASGTSGTGSVFVHWGSHVAPPGSTLLYTGYAFSGHYNHSGGPADILVMQADDPGGDQPGVVGSLFYPVALTPSTSLLPPGVSGDTLLKAAVCYSPTSTTIIWGTHTAPAGWSILYSGHAMGNYYTHANSSDVICVDSAAYDGGPAPSGATALLYASKIEAHGGLTGYPFNKFVKCAVIAKD